MSIEISIIICTYNRDKYIYQTLEHIARNHFPPGRFEIVLVNNNSTDHTESECLRFQKAYPSLTFRYFMELKQGLSHARNRGIRESQGETLVFLDDDAFVGTTYLQRLSEYLQTYPDAAAFGGKITPRFESGHTPSWLGKWSYSWVSALDKGTQVCLFKGKSYPIGANMGIKRAAVPEGEFNTALGRNKNNLMGGEEKDIFNRIKAQKKSIYYFPQIEVTHMIPERRTTREYIRQLAEGVGQSERLRTQGISRSAYLKSLLMEGVKWGATLLLWGYYIIGGTPQKGNMLVYFRRYVSWGLFFRPQKTN